MAFRMHIWLTALLFSFSVAVWAQSPKDERVPGGIAVIELPYQSFKPQVQFQHKPVAVIREKGHWIAVVGLPLTLPPGAHSLTIHTESHPIQHLNFMITEKSYPTQSIRFHRKKSNKHAKPNPLLEARLEHEKELLNFYFDQFTLHQDPNFTLHLPLKGRFTGNFGLRRIYDGIAGGSHKGIDVAAPTGTPIRAAQTGKVTLVGHFFLTGKTILIDHGQGFVTAYCHLHHIQVKAGQTVTEKDIIGTVGKTGRSTGPHLHFGVSLNGTRVNPALFFS